MTLCGRNRQRQVVAVTGTDAEYERELRTLEDDLGKYQEEVSELRRYLIRENRRVSELCEHLDEVLREFPGYMGASTADPAVAEVEMAKERRISELRERVSQQFLELTEERAIDGREGMDRWVAP